MSQEAPRPVLRALSLLFLAAAGLVLIATIQLFILSESTDRFFAWHIGEPLTAAVDGAFYLAAVALLFPAARARTWSEVRPVAWGVMTISVMKLAATLLHFGTFHFDHGGPAGRVAAWGWLAVYAAIPVLLAVLIAAEHRTPGQGLASVAPSRPAFRWFAGSVSLVLVVLGVIVFVAPGAAADRWPWSLTDLTAQDLAAWFAGIGVVGLLAVRQGDAAATRSVWIGSVALAVLQAVALARYGDAFDWGAVCGWLYLALFLCVGLAGGWGWLLSRRTLERGSTR